MSKRRLRLGTKIYVIIICAVLLLYCLSLLFPIFWMLLASFKDEIDYALNAFGLPESFHFENYPIVFEKLKVPVLTSDGRFIDYGFGSMFLFSILRSVLDPLKQIFFTALMAYVMSKYKFIGNKFFYTLGIVIMIVPIYGSLPSAMLIRKAIGLYDKLIPTLLLVPPATPFSGLYFLILYGVCKAIPKDYLEAGFIDGAGHFRVMFKLIMPMIIPTCATLFVLTFLSSWNDYESFLIWYPSTPNLALGMYKFQNSSTKGSAGASPPQILAGFVLVMIPTAALYLSAQNLVVSKFTVGGLKG